VGFTVLVEIACYLYLLNLDRLEIEWRGEKNYLKSFRGLRCSIVSAAVIDAIVFGTVRQTSFRLAPYCRIYLMAALPAIRPAVLSVCEIFPSYLGVLAILVVVYILQARRQPQNGVWGRGGGCVEGWRPRARPLMSHRFTARV
jgi:hypothetical protein